LFGVDLLDQPTEFSLKTKTCSGQTIRIRETALNIIIRSLNGSVFNLSSSTGDIASASYDAIDDELVQLSAHARDGAVAVVLRNAASSSSPSWAGGATTGAGRSGAAVGGVVDLGVGSLRVAVVAFG
jgi:hypothetical protein